MTKSVWMVAVVAAALVGCGGAQGTSNDEYANATPTLDGLSLETSGVASESAALRADGLPGDANVTEEQSLSTVPEYLAAARAAIQELNQTVRATLAPVTDLLATTGVATGNVKLYGPADRGAATFRLYVKKLGERHFAWKLEAKPAGGADSAYVAVMTGSIKQGELAHRGRGVVGIDLDKLAAVDSGAKGKGKLFGAFAHVGEQKMLVYRLHDFTADPSAHAPVTGTLYGHKLLNGETRIRVAAFADVVAGPAGAEFVLARLHWLPGVGGRADILVPEKRPNGQANGDEPAGKVMIGRSCWDAQEKEAFKLVLSCEAGKAPTSATCTVVSTSGNRDACHPGVKDDDDAPTDPAATNPEAGAPGTIDDAVPSDLPEF